MREGKGRVCSWGHENEKLRCNQINTDMDISEASARSKGIYNQGIRFIWHKRSGKKWALH
jgi:hypothetical protein